MTRLVRLAASLIGIGLLLWHLGPIGAAVTLLERVAEVLMSVNNLKG